jgi:hypothetical protein
MYTYFASGFWRDGKLNQRFRELMQRLACENGWFVPVITLLDHLLEHSGLTALTASERPALERRWLRSKIRVGYS